MTKMNWRQGTAQGYNAGTIYDADKDEAVAQVYGLPLHSHLSEIDATKFGDGLKAAAMIAAAPALLRALQLHDEYLAIPQDRGGKNGPKGRALDAFIKAKRDAIERATLSNKD